MIKKIFNKILFAAVFALIFVFINKCSVKAYYYSPYISNYYSTTGNVVSYNDPASELFTNVNYGADNWTYGGVNDTPYWDQLNITELNGVYGNAYNFYVLKNKNNNNSISFGANLTSINSISNSTKKPTSMFMYHLKQDGWKYVVIQSDGDEQSISVNMIIIYEDTPPILTNVSNGNYSGNYRLTATSDSEILMFTQSFSYTSDIGNNNSMYPADRYLHVELDSDEYLELKADNSKNPIKYLWWYGSSSVGEFFSYYAVEPISWNTRNNSQDEFPFDDSRPPVEYKIEYSAINSTNNSQEIFGNDNTITGGGIAIKYLPLNNDLYNYYYYWEKDEGQEPIGNPNDITDWEQLDSSDKGIGVVVVDSNGWLYAKITDKNGNMLANNVLNYKAYGKTSLFPASYQKTDTWLGKFADQINYGGPINSIITVPINLLNTLFQSFSGTCQSFNMGAILGKNITFNCFTLQSILGSSITNVIDMLCSFFIYYHLVLFIISIYRKIMNLDDLDDYLPQHLYHPKHGDYNDYNF